MELVQIGALVRFAQRATKMAAALSAEAEALGLEAPRRRKRRKTAEAVKAAVKKAKPRAKAGPALATEEQD